MRTSVYGNLFERLAVLCPGLRTARTGTVFLTRLSPPWDKALYCRIAQLDGPMRLVEVAEQLQKPDQALANALPSVKLRVDTESRVAEVLEIEDARGYQVVYPGVHQVNPQRVAINARVGRWLQLQWLLAASQQDVRYSI